MSDYRDLDWDMFTGHMFSKKELDEIYEQGIAGDRKRIVSELINHSFEIPTDTVVNKHCVDLYKAIEIVKGGE